MHAADVVRQAAQPEEPTRCFCPPDFLSPLPVFTRTCCFSYCVCLAARCVVANNYRTAAELMEQDLINDGIVIGGAYSLTSSPKSSSPPPSRLGPLPKGGLQRCHASAESDKNTSCPRCQMCASGAYVPVHVCVSTCLCDREIYIL